MTTVDHRCEVLNRNPDDADRFEPPAPTGALRPCRAIGGAILPVPMNNQNAFEENTEEPDKSFVVGVVDTGLVLKDGKPHPWLDGHVCFGAEDEDPFPGPDGHLRADDGHGTFVTGLVLREAPRAWVRVVRGFDRDAFGDPNRPTADELRIADGVVAAAIEGLLVDTADSPRASIINLSFSGVLDEGDERPQQIRRAIEHASELGVVVVVAAGNQPRRSGVFPAAFADDGAIRNMHVVGAVDETVCRSRQDPPFVATFSNRQRWVRTYANGVYVNGPLYDGNLSYVPADHPTIHDFYLPAKSPVTGEPTSASYTGWAKWSGTSFAAAIVSGIIARHAMADRSTSVADIADRVLQPNSRIPGIGTDGELACYLRGVDSDWPTPLEITG